MFTKNSIFTFLFFLSIVVCIHAQNKGNVVVFMRMDSTVVDPLTEEYPDMTWYRALEDSGYNVTRLYTPSLALTTQDTLDILINADLIVLGRSVPTLTLGGNSADDRIAWNQLQVPIITGNMWAMRNNRLNWFNTTNIVSYGDSILRNVNIVDPADPVFNGLDLNLTEPVPWWDGQMDELGTTDAGSGILIATSESSGNVAFVRFEPLVEFYIGNPEAPEGWRTFIGNGRDNSSQPPFFYFHFTPQAKKVFFAEVANLINLSGGPKTGIEYRGDSNLPSTIELSQNYPNPFNPSTKIQFSIPNSAFTNLTVYNNLGEVIEVLVDKELSSGKYAVDFNAGNLSTGIYLYKLQSGNLSETRKMIILK